MISSSLKVAGHLHHWQEKANRKPPREKLWSQMMKMTKRRAFPNSPTLNSKMTNTRMKTRMISNPGLLESPQRKRPHLLSIFWLRHLHLCLKRMSGRSRSKAGKRRMVWVVWQVGWTNLLSKVLWRQGVFLFDLTNRGGHWHLCIVGKLHAKPRRCLQKNSVEVPVANPKRNSINCTCIVVFALNSL